VQFSLIGFRQDTGFRVFTFESTAADHTRTAYTVRADLALTRKHGIRVQELPLLCRGLLERAGEGEQKYTATFTEEEMRLHSHTCTEARDAAIRRRKSLRRPLAAQAESEI
jgi:hypothetical protein